MKSFNAHFFQFVFFVVLIILGAFFFYKIQLLVPGILTAVTLYVLNRSFYLRLAFKFRWNKYVLALLVIFINAILLSIPFGIAISIVLPKLNNLASNADQLYNGLIELVHRMNEITGMIILSDEKLKNIPAIASANIPLMFVTLLSALANIVTTFFILYFMLINSHKMESFLDKYISLKKSNKNLIKIETKNIVVSYAIGIPIIAMGQGIAASIGYFIFGVNDPLLWGFVTGVASVIPFIGSSLIWIPLVGFLFANGQQDGAIGLTIYCLVVVLQIDNVLRLILLKIFADIHPLITLFGVIIGLKLFGFIGLIFGPLLVSHFLLLIRIYAEEFSSAVSLSSSK